MRGEISVFRAGLLDWYDQQQRPLPWRSAVSLYATVVSEFMLQQTRVDTVVPYFHRWLAQFPDFAALAKAPPAAVLKAWEGLGYYSRARNLQRLAIAIDTCGAPVSVQGWLALPGVGPYTAAAIASIAQGIPAAVIDGNVVRVLSRLADDATAFASPSAARAACATLADQLIDPQRPGDYNQAIMELGATVCRKASPACSACPVSNHCKGFRSGRASQLPVIQRSRSVQRSVMRLFCRSEDAILIQQYPSNAARMASICELPLLHSAANMTAVLIRSRGIGNERIQEQIFACKSSACYRDILQFPHLCRWVPLDQLPAITLSGPHRKWLHSLLHL